MRPFIACLVCIFCWGSTLKAQPGTTGICRDSTQAVVAPGNCSYAMFEPICGCNTVTYKNDCFRQADGVLYYTPGPCEALALNVVTNPPQNNELYFEVVTRFQNQSLRIYIMDVFGHIYYNKLYMPYTRQIMNVNLSEMSVGVLLLVAETENFRQILKVVNPAAQ